MSSILSTLQKFSLTAGLPVIIITYQPWTITSTIKYWWTKNFATHYLLLSFKVIQLNENKLRGQSPHFCRIKNEGMSPSILSYWINYKEIVDFEILFFQWFFLSKTKKFVVGGFLASEFTLGELIWLDYLAGHFTLSGLIRR